MGLLKNVIGKYQSLFRMNVSKKYINKVFVYAVVYASRNVSEVINTLNKNTDGITTIRIITYNGVLLRNSPQLRKGMLDTGKCVIDKDGEVYFTKLPNYGSLLVVNIECSLHFVEYISKYGFGCRVTSYKYDGERYYDKKVIWDNVLSVSV